MAFPDPVVSANLYSSGNLDDAIRRVVLPFTQRLDDSGIAARTWMVRYQRRGEHLKVRVHSAVENRASIREHLRAVAEPFLIASAAARSADPEGPGVERVVGNAPPIDIEDEATEIHPDDALLFTTYRRSHVSLGGPPFLDRDGYASRMCACLSSACSLVLDALSVDLEGEVPFQRRHTALLKALIAGLEASDLDAGGRRDYLTYHRDWLIRFNVDSPDAEDETVRVFDQRLDAMSAALAQVGAIAVKQWSGAEEPTGGASGSPWQHDLGRLVAYASARRGDPDYRVDPFANDTIYPPVFKIFHGLANQLGLRMLDEAFGHHFLLHAADGRPAGTAVTATGAGTPEEGP